MKYIAYSPFAILAAALLDPTGSSAQTKTIPVVFHVLYQAAIDSISVAQIQDALWILGRDVRAQNPDTAFVIPAFQNLIADLEVEFCLATIGPDGDPTSGIDYIQTALADSGGVEAMFTSQWAPDRYLNIWVVRRMDIGTLDAPSPLWQTLLPAQADTMPWGDGIVLSNQLIGSIGTGSDFNSRSLTHHVGHYLGLMELWGVTDTLPAPPGHVNQLCGDDGIPDTPVTRGWTYCPTSSVSEDCSPGVPENFQNYMEYSYCNHMFTLGQKERVQATLNSSVAGRNNLWTETNLASVGCFALGVEEASVSSIMVTPNPSSDRVTVTGLPMGSSTIVLYDLVGRVQLSATSAGPEARLDIAALKAGVHIMRVRHATGERTIILVKD